MKGFHQWHFSDCICPHFSARHLRAKRCLREVGVHDSSEVDWFSPAEDVRLVQAPSGLSEEKDVSETQAFSSCSSGSLCNSISTAIPSLGNRPSRDDDPVLILECWSLVQFLAPYVLCHTNMSHG